MKPAILVACLSLGASTPGYACALDASELALGGIAIGQTEQSVRDVLGEPSRRIDTGEGWQLVHDGLVVWIGYFDEPSIAPGTKRVFGILGTSDAFCTPAGICPGSDVATVESAYGRVEPTHREDGSYLEYAAEGSSCWLQLRPVDGKIESIRVECQP